MTPKDYRAKADQIRLLAESMSDEGARNDLLKMASEYEALASGAQCVDRSQRLVRLIDQVANGKPQSPDRS